MPTSVDRRRYLVLDVGPTRLGFDVSAAREVFNLPTRARVPWAPPWVQGVAHRHGKLITLVDLGRFLDVPEPGVPQVGVLLDRGDLSLALVGTGVQVVDGRNAVRVTELRYFVPNSALVLESLSTPAFEFHHIDIEQVVFGIAEAF